MINYKVMIHTSNNIMNFIRLWRRREGWSEVTGKGREGRGGIPVGIVKHRSTWLREYRYFEFSLKAHTLNQPNLKKLK